MGIIKIITGPMYSGKTTRLVQLLNEAILYQRCLLLRPSNDTRLCAAYDNISNQVDTCIIGDLAFISNEEIERYDVIAIDETQFFSNVVCHVNRWANQQDLEIICVGLVSDYKFEPFGDFANLLCTAEEVDRLSTDCYICGEEAFFTKRTNFATDQISIDKGLGEYIPVCRKCHNSDFV